MKVKLKAFYITYHRYISLTFSLILVAFFYALHKGDVKSLVEVLKVAQAIITVLCSLVG